MCDVVQSWGYAIVDQRRETGGDRWLMGRRKMTTISRGRRDIGKACPRDLLQSEFRRSSQRQCCIAVGTSGTKFSPVFRIDWSWSFGAWVRVPLELRIPNLVQCFAWLEQRNSGRSLIAVGAGTLQIGQVCSLSRCKSDFWKHYPVHCTLWKIKFNVLFGLELRGSGPIQCSTIAGTFECMVAPISFWGEDFEGQTQSNVLV